MTKFLDSFFSKNKIALTVFLIFGFLCGAIFRFQEMFWDTINYHYYNAWAFLNDRMNVDVIPAYVNTFFSPFIELPFYYLVNALDDHPVLFSAIMALPYGGLLFTAYKITTLFFPADTPQGRIRIGLTIMLSICSYAVFEQLSGETHEHSLSMLTLIAFYLLLKSITLKTYKARYYVISGFLLGVAAGLKMTYCLYAAGTGISLILFFRRLDKPGKSILLFTLAGTIGFLLTYGYWGWLMWKNYQNPIFPFFNNIFHSPYWLGPNYSDIRYFEKTWLTVLLWPFFLFYNINYVVPLMATHNVSYLRVSIAMVFILLFLFRPVTSRISVRFKTRKREQGIGFLMFASYNKDGHYTKENDHFNFLILWMIVVYIIWLIFFRIYRYLIPFDLMLAIILIHFLFRKSTIKFPDMRLTLLVLFSIYSAFEMSDCYSRPVDKSLLPIKTISVPDHSLLVLNQIPSAIFVPFLAKNDTIRAVLDPKVTTDVNGTRFHTTGYFASMSRKIIQEAKEKKQTILEITGRTRGRPCLKIGELTYDKNFTQPYYLCWEK